MRSLTARSLSALCFIWMAINGTAQVPLVEQRWWMPNGAVRAIAEDSITGTVYLGGDFTTVSPPRALAYGADVSASSSAPNAGMASPDGPVYTSIPDGSGGWYIGGNFEHVGGIPRERVAHLKPDGSLDMAWTPVINGPLVLSLLLKGDTVIMGGQFDAVNGSPRGFVALVHRTTGALFPYNADVGPGVVQVRDMVLKGDTLILAGTFGTVGGQPRLRLAQVNLATGALLPWNPNTNNSVYTIDYAGGQVYVGGLFTTLGGANRTHIGAVDVSTGMANGFAPGASDVVHDIRAAGSQVYACGAFTTFGGQTRNRLAQVSTTGVLGAWNPNANFTVNELTIVGSTIYVGGDFNFVGGATRNRLAALGLPGSGQPLLLPWNPNANNEVESISATASRVYVGGDYLSIGVLSRARLVALDEATGEPLAWNPGANAPVRALSLGSNGVLYVGGDFTQLGSNTQTRLRAAAIGLPSDMATIWNPAADAPVMDILANGASVLLSGSFATIGGTARRALAAVDAGFGALTSWNVTTGSAGQHVEQMLRSGDTLFVCGTFSTLNGVTRGPLASVLLSSNTVTSFAPLPNDFVHTMAKRGNVIYASGYFTTIGGLGGQSFVAGVNATTGTHTGWNPGVNGPQFGVAATSAGVFLQCLKPGPGGNLYGIHGFNTTTAAQTGYSIGVNGSTLFVRSASKGRLFIGGEFTLVDGASRQGFAALRDKPSLRLKAALEGPFNVGTGLMSDALRSSSLLPLTEPYTALGYAHVGGGGETVPGAMLTLTGNDAVVDWILVELRNAAAPHTPIATQSALLQRDGDIVDRNGGPVSFPVQTGSYHVSLRHRNHLGVMTAAPLSLASPVSQIDFRSPSTLAYGTDARKDLAGTMALWAGDVTFNGQVKYTGSGNDRDPILTTVGSTTPNNTVTLYSTRDVNMNGQVKYTGSGNDRDPILVNVGSTTPNNVRSTQLP